MWRLATLPLLLALAPACEPPVAPDGLVGPHHAEYAVPGWRDRAWLLHLPASYDGTAPIPVVLGLHGGGGRKEGFDRTGCPGGDVEDPGCLSALADREGFALVVPDGVDARGLRGRSWNAGGGEGGFRCVGGEACATASDDVAYFDALLGEVRRAVRTGDVFATGISNGGAMSHRLACERADVFSAIAAVGGANQAGAWPGCAPSRPVPVLQIHGTEDPCWGYDGSIRTGLCADSGEGAFVGVEDSTQAWRERNGCAGTDEVPLPDSADDGTTTTRVAGVGCAADTVLLRVEGGGHTWPLGWQYLPEPTIGRVALDFSGNEEIWAFFAAHRRE